MREQGEVGGAVCLRICVCARHCSLKDEKPSSVDRLRCGIGSPVFPGRRRKKAPGLFAG